MKSIVKPAFYFSAYPLKVIKDTTADKEPGSPYLKALLSGKTKRSTRARVLPMINPYTRQYTPAPMNADKLPKDIELSAKEWFNNYE